MKPAGDVLRAEEYAVEVVPLSMCADLVRRYHYTGGGANTATVRHGLRAAA